MKILAFGQIAEVTQQVQWEIEKIPTLTALREYLHETYPILATMTYLVAVNQQIIKDDISLESTDIIALLPPFSGG